MLNQHERWLADPLKGYPNDIALLRLTEEPDMSDERIGMACIPDTTDFNFTGNPDCWISGWGKIDCKYQTSGTRYPCAYNLQTRGF